MIQTTYKIMRNGINGVKELRLRYPASIVWVSSGGTFFSLHAAYSVIQEKQLKDCFLCPYIDQSFHNAILAENHSLELQIKHLKWKINQSDCEKDYLQMECNVLKSQIVYFAETLERMLEAPQASMTEEIQNLVTKTRGLDENTN